MSFQILKVSDYGCIISLISKNEAINLLQDADLTEKSETLKMEKTVIKFGDIEIQNQEFHQHRGPISVKNVDIDKIVVSNTVSSRKKGFKYFIGYKDAKKLDLYVYFSQK